MEPTKSLELLAAAAPMSPALSIPLRFRVLERIEVLVVSVGWALGEMLLKIYTEFEMTEVRQSPHRSQYVDTNPGEGLITNDKSDTKDQAGRVPGRSTAQWLPGLDRSYY